MIVSVQQEERLPLYDRDGEGREGVGEEGKGGL